MVPDVYHDFFVAAASASAALIGLLFVAISVSPERVFGSGATVAERARAASALSALLAPLVLSLAALLPNSNAGIPSIIVGVSGLLFVVATIRTYFSVPKGQREDPRGLIGLVGFTVILLVFIGFGILLIVHRTTTSPLGAICGASIASIVLGVDRAWALIGARSISRGASLMDIVHPDKPTSTDD